MDFLRAVKILFKRKWLLTLAVVVTAGLSYGAARLAGSKWVGTVQLIALHGAVGAKQPPTTSIDVGAPTEEFVSQDSVKGQVAMVFSAIARSSGVVQPVLRKLRINSPPQDFQKNIIVRSTGPRLFQLEVTASNMRSASQLANGLADQFVIEYQKLNSAQEEQAAAFISDQLNDTNAKLDSLHKAYDEYRNRHGIDLTVANNMDTALARLRMNREQYDVTSEKIAEAKARLQALESEPLPTVVPQQGQVTSPEVAQLQRDLDDSERALAALRLRYTDAWPEVKKAVVHRDDLKNRLLAAKAKPANQPELMAFNQNPKALRQIQKNDIDQTLAGLGAERTFLDSTLGDARHDIDQLKGTDEQLNSLTAQIADQTEVRSSLTARLRDVQTLQDVTKQQDPIAVMSHVDQFNPPVNLNEGRTPKIVALGALCGLLLASALMISLDNMDRRLRSVTDAEIVLPGRVITAIPQPMGPVSYKDLARATELQPQSLHAEAFRFLGLHVLNQSPPIRSMMMLSAKAEQGSTTALTNLGITLAQAGKRVIIVDANIRTPELHEVFRLSNAFGFTDLLRKPDSTSLGKALQATTVKNLQVITSGPRPANPWELFRSANMIELSHQLKENADYVLYDTPSALMFTDALNLAPVTDAAFLCVRALEPLTGSEHRMLELVEQANVMVMGSILTHVPSVVIEGFHNYQHYYAPGNNGAGVIVSPELLEPTTNPANDPMVIDTPVNSDTEKK